MSRIVTFLAILAASLTIAFAQDGVVTSKLPSTRPPRVRVSTGVMLGLVQHKPMPVYPDEAMTKGIQGDAIFKVDIDETGRIVSTIPIDGDPLLIAASVEAMRDFRFRPYLLNGTPTIMESVLGFHFAVQKSADGVNGRVDCMQQGDMPANLKDRPEFRTGSQTASGLLILDARKISGPEPNLPPDLAGKSGSVYLTVTIGEDGKVQDVKVVGGDEAFIGPVVEAVKQAVYEPLLVDGKPSVEKIEASYHFGTGH
jgi:outer membrane biosynthesis protein TonB